MIKQLLHQLAQILTALYKSLIAAPIRVVTPAKAGAAEKEKYSNTVKITRYRR